jgi:hypothetical protein
VLYKNVLQHEQPNLSELYKSRKTIIELLEYSGFDEYTGFNINEIDVMFKNYQLDMLMVHPATNKKTYIKYYCSPKQTIRSVPRYWIISLRTCMCWRTF